MFFKDSAGARWSTRSRSWKRSSLDRVSSFVCNALRYVERIVEVPRVRVDHVEKIVEVLS